MAMDNAVNWPLNSAAAILCMTLVSGNQSAIVAGCKRPKFLSRSNGLLNRCICTKAKSTDSCRRNNEGIQDKQVLVWDAKVLVNGICLALL